MTLATWAAAVLLAAGADSLKLPSPPPPAATATPAAPPSAVAVPAPPPPEMDSRALAPVKRMSDRLRQAKAFTLKARVALELPVGGGALATLVNDAVASVQRPDKLVATRTGDLPEFHFAYDGRSMTIYAPGKGQWGTAAAPPTLDAMIVAAVEQAGLSFPFDEILVADPYAAITRDLTQATLVGQTTMGGKKVDHVVLASPGLELQFWIDTATALPVRVAVVYANQPLRHHFSVDYSEWHLDLRLPASTFVLSRPADSKQVEFRAAAAAYR